MTKDWPSVMCSAAEGCPHAADCRAYGRCRFHEEFAAAANAADAEHFKADVTPCTECGKAWLHENDWTESPGRWSVQCACHDWVTLETTRDHAISLWNENGFKARTHIKCADCGCDYDATMPMSLLIPKAQWLTIHPEDGGVLCANCIVRRAARLPKVINITGRVTFADDTQDHYQAFTVGSDIERLAAEVHRTYLLTAARLGWTVKPEMVVPYADLSEDAKELDRATVRAVLACTPSAAHGKD